MRNNAQYKGNREHEGQVNRLMQTRTKQGGVVPETEEAGQEEHMGNTNKDKAMCSNTKQTSRH